LLNECQKEKYGKAFNANGEYNSTESLFMALIFQQQKKKKMIGNLVEEHSKDKEHQKVI
jgi:hypothetical protein